jgi:hypothetical protein
MRRGATCSGIRPVLGAFDWGKNHRVGRFEHFGVRPQKPSNVELGSDPVSPDEYCQQKAAKSGSSFYYSFLFLPPSAAARSPALYAFCREVDDIADEVTDVGIARTKLAWWRHRGREPLRRPSRAPGDEGAAALRAPLWPRQRRA